MGFVAISEESQPDGTRINSYSVSQIIMTHMESHFINQPSRIQKIFFLRKSNSVLCNIFLNMLEKLKGTENVVFGDI